MPEARFHRAPKSVKVGHHKISIRFLTEQQWHKEGHQPNDAGNSWWSAGTINVRTEIDGVTSALPAIQETLLHEVLHMCYEVSGLRNKGAIEEDKVEEYMVAGLSFPLIAVLQENPKLLAYLTQ